VLFAISAARDAIVAFGAALAVASLSIVAEPGADAAADPDVDAAADPDVDADAEPGADAGAGPSIFAIPCLTRLMSSCKKLSSGFMFGGVKVAILITPIWFVLQGR
jgi:hypothetical protein